MARFGKRKRSVGALPRSRQLGGLMLSEGRSARIAASRVLNASTNGASEEHTMSYWEQVRRTRISRRRGIAVTAGAGLGAALLAACGGSESGGSSQAADK